MRIGIIGKGSFGKRVKETLESKYNVAYFTGREMNIDTDIDWVIIASSNESHYRLARKFIDAGVNTFVTKPGCESYRDLHELVTLASNKGVKFYVDDLFLYHPTFKKLKKDIDDGLKGNIKFSWEKYGSFKSSIFNNLSYHDIYMAITLNSDISPESVEFVKNGLHCKKFKINNCSFYYDRKYHFGNRKYVRVDNAMYEFDYQNDSLLEMFDTVFKMTDFRPNNVLALKTQLVIDSLNRTYNKPKVAVVGAGIFGVTAALKLVESFQVDLFEQNDSILEQASGINQYRLHRGYHYPRSKETARASMTGTNTFLEFYDCESHTEQYYAIAKDGSKVTTDEYEQFLHDMKLQFSEVDLPLVKKSAVSKVYRVNESVFNFDKLKDICEFKLRHSDVNLILNTKFDKSYKHEYDYVVICTYATLNDTLDNDSRNFQFELCEKPLVKLPTRFKGKGIVIMDGPFTCIDPYGDTNYHVVGNVVHSIHKTNVGKHPEIPMEYRNLLNKRIIRNPELTNWPKFEKSLNEFFDIGTIKHLGSMFTIRTVLPNRDHDDARPTIIAKDGDSEYSILSGKISTAVDAARQLYSDMIIWKM